MEWYWILAIVLGFVGAVLGMIYVCKKGLISKEQISAVSGIVSGLNTMTAAMAESGNGFFGVANMIMTFVDKAVKSAENAYYNELIDKDQRREYCIEKLEELMNAYGVELTKEQWNAVDTLIEASCEEMGHTEVLVEEE